MAEMEYYTYKRSADRGLNEERKSRTFAPKDFFIRMLGFFLAMAVPYNGLAPFGMSFMAQERKLSAKAVITFIAVSLGASVVCDRLSTAKYVASGLLYLAMLFVLERDIRLGETVAAIGAGICVFMTGLVALFWQGFKLIDLLILVCEGIAVGAGALVIDKSHLILEQGSVKPESLSGEEKLSLAAVILIAVLSLKEVYLGTDFSVMHVASAIILLWVSTACGAAYSTGCGVVLGMVCGIGDDYFMPILGAYCFCGFLSGILSKFGKSGAVAGTVLANGVLVVYTNGAMEAVMSLYEILTAAVIFAFIPRHTVMELKKALTLDENERRAIQGVKEEVEARLRSVATSFESMAHTLMQLSDNTSSDDSDIASLFDMAAERVCKKCRKVSVCWNKDFDYTYSSMFKLMETMDEKGVVAEGDAEESFRSRCINLPGLVSELNHQFDIHQVRRVWRGRLRESRDLVGEQLTGMSRIIDGISGEISYDMKNRIPTAGDIRKMFEDRGINLRDVNVVSYGGGRFQAEISLRSVFWKDKHKAEVKKIMRRIMGGEIKVKDCLFDDGKYVKLEFRKAERFRVETDSACRALCGKNGDNYRFSHISGGKYVIAISDGMGTGSRAARESRAMLELLDSFLRAGFESKTAVKFINSVMVLKSEEDDFVTIDICIIDLYTGMAEFIKTGAEPSFILRNSRVDTVRSASLPVGILADMEAETSMQNVTDGDVIVMLTDGIEPRDGKGDLWVGDFIRESCKKGCDPNLADKILDHAIERSGGQVRDDMTVLSVKIKSA